jgi:hypothetical protein
MRHEPTTRLLLCVFLCSAVPLIGGQSPHDPSHQAKRGDVTRSTTKDIDVCTLLTGADVEAVLGEPVKERRHGAQPTGGLLTSQCVFVMATPARSVSVAVAVPGAKQPSATPRGFWREQFHPSDRATGHRREEESREPRVIKGLGDEAYWVSNRIGGAMYVLISDMFLRLSLGGLREESARIEKSIALARVAVERLRASHIESRPGG